MHGVSLNRGKFGYKDTFIEIGSEPDKLMIAIDQLKERYGTEMATTLLCCRVFLGTAAATDLDHFTESNEIDWVTFMALCRGHRIRPVVYKVIGASASLPVAIGKKIRDEQATLVMTNWKLAMETERIISVMKDNGIEMIPYKGTAFSKQFYGDLVSRESSDIDIIIQQKDLTKAAILLKKDGYLPEMEDAYHYLGDRFYDYYKDYNLNKFKNGSRVFHLELHWAIAEKFIGLSPRIDDYLYHRNRQINLVKADMAVMDDTAHFSAILIHHALKDNFAQLKNVLDLSQAIKQPAIQAYAPQLIYSFHIYHLNKALSISNFLTRELMGVSFGKISEEQIDGDTASYFKNQVCATASAEYPNGQTQFLKWMSDTVLLQDTYLRRIRFYLICFKYRFIPGIKDFRTFHFPKALFFLYYLVKPFRTWFSPLDKMEEKRKLVPVDEG